MLEGVYKREKGEREKTYAKLNIRREEINALVLIQGALDKRRRHNPLLTLQPPQKRIGKLGTRIRHRERRRPSAILGLDDFIPAILNPMHNLAIHLTRNLLALCVLREQGDDGRARVAADDGDGYAVGVLVEDLADEAGGADDVEGGDAEETFWVEDAGFFEGFGDDGDG